MALIHSLSRGFTIRAAATTVVAARATRARVAPAGIRAVRTTRSSPFAPAAAGRAANVRASGFRFRAISTDSAGNVSATSNTVTTEVCDPEDTYEDDFGTGDAGLGDRLADLDLADVDVAARREVTRIDLGVTELFIGGACVDVLKLVEFDRELLDALYDFGSLAVLTLDLFLEFDLAGHGLVREIAKGDR
mgnify:CR=1 FL=1